jgi:hypothetical protein
MCCHIIEFPLTLLNNLQFVERIISIFFFSLKVFVFPPLVLCHLSTHVVGLHLAMPLTAGPLYCTQGSLVCKGWFRELEGIMKIVTKLSIYIAAHALNECLY